MRIQNKEKVLDEIKAIVEANYVDAGMGDNVPVEYDPPLPIPPVPSQQELWTEDYSDKIKFGLREMRDCIAKSLYDILFDTKGDSSKVAEAGSTDPVGQGREEGTGEFGDFFNPQPTEKINKTFSPAPQASPGTNVIFTTPEEYISGTIKVYVGGIRLRSDEFSESGSNQITLVVAPAEGVYVHGDYSSPPAS